MISKDISLRGLEVFEAVARSGSVARAAGEIGLSLPAVSQQLKSLEESLGRPLLDHARRPMVLTTAGEAFLHRAVEVLRQLRQGMAEARVPDLRQVTQLRLGVIDDFDNHVTPELTATLAGALTDCEFRLFSHPSRELCEMARARQLDLAVAASPEGGIDGLIEHPLVVDPFVLIAPRGFMLSPDPVTALTALPFLRYDRGQMIGQQIEAQLRRLKLSFPSRFELGANPAILALVAHGRGWAITTALSFLRSERFHERIDLHPLPFAPFARTISLFAAEDWIPDAASEVARTIRGLLGATVLPTARDRFPWLADSLALRGGG